MLTHKDQWDIFTENLPVPQSWLDFAWYFLIGSALQRRVWLYDNLRPLFPNQYVCLVGPPGTGKGLVLSPVADIMRYHKKEKGVYVKTSIGRELPTVFAVGADSITFEGLVAEIAKSTARVATPNNEAYFHCSYAFILEELSSLFKHKTSDVVKFLQNAYDCKSYDYRTKSQGHDNLRNLCMSFIAGTQPEFLKEAADAHIFTQGFASRSLFLFEKEPRFHAFHFGNLSESQKECYANILAWIKKLSTVYGQVSYDADTYAFLEDWYKTDFVPSAEKATGRMQNYWSRKKVIMLKLAMAIHYSDSVDPIMSINPLKQAIAMLRSIEPSMAAGLNMAGRNALHLDGRRMLQFIRDAGKKGVSKQEIVLEFGADLDIQKIEMCIKELELGYGVKKTLQTKKYYVG